MTPRKILFVCVGNSCRSQMAEGFARTYGPDVLTPSSAGLFAAPDIAPVTRKVMLDKNIDLAGQFPKDLGEVDLSGFDLIVNMSGYPFPEKVNAPLREWQVQDPIGEKEDVHRRVAQQIETQVMQLILNLRAGREI